MAVDSINNQRGYYYTFTPQKARYNANADNIFATQDTGLKTADNPIQDTFEKTSQSSEADKDDGKIGLWGALKNIGKGAVKFFTGMFTDENGDFSLLQTAKTVGMIAGITAATFIPVIGPLVLPALCVYGMFEGGKHVVEGISGAINAKTDTEAEQAWQEVGSGATEGALSATGYRTAGGIKGAFNKSKTQFQKIYNTNKESIRIKKSQNITTNETNSTCEKVNRQENISNAEVNTESISPDVETSTTAQPTTQTATTGSSATTTTINTGNTASPTTTAMARINSLESVNGDQTLLSFAHQDRTLMERVLNEHVNILDGIHVKRGIGGGHCIELYTKLIDIIRNPFNHYSIHKNAIKEIKKVLPEEHRNANINITGYDNASHTITLKIGETEAKIIRQIGNEKPYSLEINGETKIIENTRTMYNKLFKIFEDNTGTPQPNIKYELVKKHLHADDGMYVITDAAVNPNGSVITIKFNKFGSRTTYTYELKINHIDGDLIEYEQLVDGNSIGMPKTTVPEADMDVIRNAIKNADDTHRLPTYKEPSPIPGYNTHTYYLKYKNHYYAIQCPDGNIATVHPIRSDFVRTQLDITKIPQLELSNLYSLI